MKNNLNIGMNLKKIRTETGLTQKALAEKSSLSHSFICQIEKGKHQSVGAVALQSIAKVLNVDINQLLNTEKAA